MPRNIRVHFLGGGGDMIVLSTLSYCIIGLGPFTADEFVLVDIRALQLLSPNYPIDVIQSNIPQVKNLPTPSHKRKRDADDDEGGTVGGPSHKRKRGADDEERGTLVGARVKAIEDEVGGDDGGQKFIKTEDDWRVKVKTEDDGDGKGRGKGRGRMKFIKAEPEEVIVISDSDD
ncbi:hypothetical protein HK104_005390 [Borealophlyctis nickersoniae]|nr:hypothetical protein HK104_005390 [Borealophlyctis nickersoniae]